MKEAASFGGLFFLQRRTTVSGISPVMNRAKEGAALKTTPIKTVTAVVT
jgi:hypothetical protein